MIIIRDVLQYNNAQPLVAEVKITEDEFNRIRTLMLIKPDEPVELPTSLYWYFGGNPPKPIYLDCPRDWQGKLVTSSITAVDVNKKFMGTWFLKYKPLTDSSGSLR